MANESPRKVAKSFSKQFPTEKIQILIRFIIRRDQWSFGNVLRYCSNSVQLRFHFHLFLLVGPLLRRSCIKSFHFVVLSLCLAQHFPSLWLLLSTRRQPDATTPASEREISKFLAFNQSRLVSVCHFDLPASRRRPLGSAKCDPR